MLHDPARHEPLEDLEWDEDSARRTIERLASDAEQTFFIGSQWPSHPLDADGSGEAPIFNLYFGASGVVWALHYLHAQGAIELRHSYGEHVDRFVSLNRRWLRAQRYAAADTASLLMGDTGILLVRYGLAPGPETAARLEALIGDNIDHPTRELMWGSPGTMLAALFLHRWTGEPRWAALYRATARKLWSQLLVSTEHRCRYWTQELYGTLSTYLDAVHGFVATAAVLVRGRDLLEPDEWAAWERCIVDTVRNTAIREGIGATWPAFLHWPHGDAQPQRRLMQFCHGAPGFVICLAELPTRALDDDLVAGGEATWAAGPLRKGSNLCHGTGGNGYAFLKLYRRTGEERWLARARAFAMHGIQQTEAHARRYGRLRYSLWTGDPGFAVYLWDCINGSAAFPTLDTFGVRA